MRASGEDRNSPPVKSAHGGAALRNAPADGLGEWATRARISLRSVQHPARMLRPQPALQTFAASANSGIGPTDRSRDQDEADLCGNLGNDRFQLIAY